MIRKLYWSSYKVSVIIVVF